MKYFRTSVAVETKPDFSPVTAADLEIERTLRGLITTRYPAHAVLGEEEGGALTEGLTWVLDPIDGTKSFLFGLPLFGTLIGLVDRGRPFFGLIEVPAMRERWSVTERGAELNGSAVRVSSCQSMKAARLATTDPQMFVGSDVDRYRSAADKVFACRYGTDCYGYGLLASGHCDLVIEANLKLYDVLPLIPVIEGAGGIITDWNGRSILEGFDGRVLAAATGELHEEALMHLQGGH